MKVWSREERSRTLTAKDYDELAHAHEQISHSIWRTQYHVQPVTGLLNDPNGFCWYKGKWHLFYQWFPFGPVHGQKHWYHVQSDDLVHFENVGLGMKPDTWYDNHGCYSGSALVEDDLVYFVYTGNNRDENYIRHPYQLLAGMNQDNRILKYEEPLIQEDKEYTEHQRDPKIFRRHEDEMYYILMGAQNLKKQGKFLMYRSNQIHTGWQKLGELKVRGMDDFGYMIECPDIEKIGDKYVLIFSPQGLPAHKDRFLNKFNNVCLVGDLDLYHMEFIPDGDLQMLDAGFEFYAAQCANQSLYKDAAILEGWFGCSDYTYPATDEEGWDGLISLPRQLTIENGKLMQRPVKDADSLKKDLIFEVRNGSIVKDQMHAEMPRACIMEVNNAEDKSLTLNLFTWGRERGFEISYDADKKKLTIDRSAMANQFNTEFGTSRSVHLDKGLSKMQIFVDHSAIEIFVNDGETVMSSRIFPEKSENMIRMAGSDIDIKVWLAGRSVQDDLKL